MIVKLGARIRFRATYTLNDVETDPDEGYFILIDPNGNKAKRNVTDLTKESAGKFNHVQDLDIVGHWPLVWVALGTWVARSTERSIQVVGDPNLV